jgi:hypothetical protein
MYLPLSVALGDTSAANLADRIFNGRTPQDNYFDNTLELLGLVDAVFSQKVDINSTPTAMPVVRTQPAVPAPQAAALNNKPVALPTAVGSGWGKEVRYTVNNNTLTVRGTGQDGDYDSIALGTINTEDYNKLVVTMRSIEGRIDVSRHIGISIDSQNYANYDVASRAAFPAPAGKRITNDNLIDGRLSVGEQLVYDITGKGQIYLGAKVYVAPNASITYSFELQK